MKLILISAAMLALCGCAAGVDARNEMLASKTAFKRCLAEHPQDAKACDGASAAFQADLAAYQALPQSIAMSGGGGDQMVYADRAAAPPRQSDFASFGAR
jgi:hypothetical protein